MYIYIYIYTYCIIVYHSLYIVIVCHIIVYYYMFNITYDSAELGFGHRQHGKLQGASRHQYSQMNTSPFSFHSEILTLKPSV